MVSAHWYTDGTFITGNNRPPTIHDFYGFPRELHEVQYPAPGDPELARRVRDLIGEGRAELNDQWGLDFPIEGFDYSASMRAVLFEKR